MTLVLPAWLADRYGIAAVQKEANRAASAWGFSSARIYWIGAPRGPWKRNKHRYGR